jgi:hypothetical protein
VMDDPRGGLGPGVVDSDDDSDDLAALDEAGAGLNEYRRGKRLKRLVKALMGPRVRGLADGIRAQHD